MTKNKKFLVIGGLLAAMVVGVFNAGAAPKVGRPAKVNSKAASKAATPAAPLSAEGEKLFALYSSQLTTLQTEITKALPTVDEQQKTAFVKAYQAEAEAFSAELMTGRALNGKHGGKDTNDVAEAHEKAKESLAKAATNALAPSKAVLASLVAFLTSDQLDEKLVKFVVLNQATPRGLAEFAQEGKEQGALVEKLLADNALMKQMVIAGGAQDGKYGQAMQIYADIQKASSRAKDGFLQRLALGTSLEHAVPIAQVNPEALSNAPAIIDPVKRYLHFEKACLDGELDPAFKDLTTWDYRMVVDIDAPDSILAWGREMLRNYRPDHIATPDYRWRYVKAVKTEVKYGSADQKYDLPTLQLYQNIMKTGGVCGRRAWFGGYILRCFGIPTVRRPQNGHAALAHWTPDGWVINLGAGWDWGWTKYGEGVDFAVYTQARKDEKAFLPVLRAKWVGDVLGETQVFGFCSEPSGLWNGVALYQQRAIVEAGKMKALAAVGQDIAEANVSKEADVVVRVEVTEADRKIDVSPDGVITIPAVACTNTSTNTSTIVFMKSNLGGLQMHYERVSKPATFEYSFEAPQAGKYALSARVVTVSPDQSLLVKPNDAKEAAVMNMPYTVGMWQKSEPVEISLVKGKNVLKCSRPSDYRGLTIKDFTLTPLK